MGEYQVMESLEPQKYAALKESIALIGVRVPIIFDEYGKIIDGHHRYKAVSELGIKDFPREIVAGLNEEQKRALARSLNMTRRELSSEQKRKVIRQQIVETPHYSDRQMSTMLGCDHKTIGKYRRELESTGEIPRCDRKAADGRIFQAQKKIVSIFNPTKRAEIALQDEKVVEHMVNTNLSARKAQEYLRREEKMKRKDGSSAALKPEDCRLFVGDIKSGLPEVEPESIDCIITDPPYGGEYIDLFEPLSLFAQRVLKPSGVLVCMCGQYRLDEKMTALSKYLRYHWLISYVAERTSPNLSWLKVAPRFKAVLLYVKNTYVGDLFTDIIKIPPEAGDRDTHIWGQSIEGMMKFADMFTDANPKQIICDPFMGAGATAIAALRLGRRFIGSDVDSACVEMSRKRVEDEFGLLAK